MADNLIQFDTNKVNYDAASGKIMLTPEPLPDSCGRPNCGENTPDYITAELLNFKGARVTDYNPNYPGSGALHYSRTTGDLSGKYVLRRVEPCAWEIETNGGIGLILAEKIDDVWTDTSWAIPIFSIIRIWRVGVSERVLWRWATFCSITGDWGLLTSPGYAWYATSDMVYTVSYYPWSNTYDNTEIIATPSHATKPDILDCTATDGVTSLELGAGPYGIAWSPTIEVVEGVDL